MHTLIVRGVLLRPQGIHRCRCRGWQALLCVYVFLFCCCRCRSVGPRWLVKGAGAWVFASLFFCRPIVPLKYFAFAVFLRGTFCLVPGVNRYFPQVFSLTPPQHIAALCTPTLTPNVSLFANPRLDISYIATLDRPREGGGGGVEAGGGRLGEIYTSHHCRCRVASYHFITSHRVA